MIKFSCKKLGRDKGLEGFKAQNITPIYKLLSGNELCEALVHKLIEESHEVGEARDRQEIIDELADVLEVVTGLCKAHGVSIKEVEQAKEKKCSERGGFEKGLYIETLEMDETNPRIEHFRKSPEKYPEV
jgi:predicted house-cleaning noncanonical NTP pyrophosphatase (MazG superfamily)